MNDAGYDRDRGSTLRLKYFVTLLLVFFLTEEIPHVTGNTPFVMHHIIRSTATVGLCMVHRVKLA